VLSGTLPEGVKSPVDGTSIREELSDSEKSDSEEKVQAIMVLPQTAMSVARTKVFKKIKLVYLNAYIPT
jgi:hypothetical protein|tara:strand:- start:129 stop:335 length:207 start_codon:yes stop_codon:yes gene_type:complete